jgi:hypothetical protein
MNDQSHAMMPSCFNSEGVQFAFDSTSLGWAETCPRLYQYNMLEGWSHLHGNVHLEFGGHYATALEHFHKHLATGMDREQALREIVREALCATWDAELGIPRGWDHTSKTRPNLIRTIIWYVDHFNPDPLHTVLLGDGRPAVEYSFTLELADDVLYCGHIDRLVDYNGDIYVQDQKTTGSTVTPNYFAKFAPDVQMSGYAYASSIFYQSPVKGVIIDAAQIAVGFSRFERGFTFRTPMQLEEWRTDTLHHIAAIQQHTRAGYYPQNRTSCDKFGGCAFRDVCSKSPEVRKNFLAADFEQTRKWNPLDRR